MDVRTQLPHGSGRSLDAEAAELAEELAHLRLHVIPQLQRELQDNPPPVSDAEGSLQVLQYPYSKEKGSVPQRQLHRDSSGHGDDGREDGSSDGGVFVEQSKDY